MSGVSLDLRFKASVRLSIDEGVSYQIYINNITNLDTGYTFNGNGITKTVGNGITLTTDSIIISILNTDFPKGKYECTLVSDSMQAGIYKKFNIEIISYEC